MYSDSPLHPSRRSFISSVAAGVGTVSLMPACLASATALPPLSFLVVSDTHVGYRNSQTAAKRWVQTAKALSKAKGDIVLHLGDLIDARKESQYPIYLETRKTIGKPIYEIPGNHDPQELFQKYIRKQVDTTVDHGWLRFILLNNSHTDSHDGFITDEQNAWIEKECARAAKDGKFVAMCLHVPVVKNRPPDRAWYVKPANGQTKFYETMTKHKDGVLALMHGHFHNGIRGWDDRAPLHQICFPSALYNQNRGLAAKKAPGFNLPLFDPGFTEVTIERGVMNLKYVPVGGKGEAVVKACKLPQIS